MKQVPLISAPVGWATMGGRGGNRCSFEAARGVYCGLLCGLRFTLGIVCLVLLRSIYQEDTVEGGCHDR